MAEQGNATVVKKFLCPDLTTTQFMEQWRNLSDEDKRQLGEGIKDGSYTY